MQPVLHWSSQCSHGIQRLERSASCTVQREIEKAGAEAKTGG